MPTYIGLANVVVLGEDEERERASSSATEIAPTTDFFSIQPRGALVFCEFLQNPSNPSISRLLLVFFAADLHLRN